jgi:cholesterol transport system auxiliary component
MVMSKESLTGLLRAASCACLLLLGGCVHSTKATFTRHYDLGAPASASAHAHPASNRGQVLEISNITTPDWLADTAMHYRLDYENDRRLAAYGRADWIAPPAALLQPIIQHAIAAGGGWRAVVGSRNPAKADASLQLQLDDFSQAFSQSNESAGVIDVTATLVDNHDDGVIAQRHFHVEIAAPSPDAQGGVEALAKASRRLAAQLQSWLKASATTSD